MNFNLLLQQASQNPKTTGGGIGLLVCAGLMLSVQQGWIQAQNLDNYAVITGFALAGINGLLSRDAKKPEPTGGTAPEQITGVDTPTGDTK